MNIENKVAVVTGGASGLGEATVRRYAEAGAKVAIFDLNQEAGQALADELGDAVCNIRSEEHKSEIQKHPKI